MAASEDNQIVENHLKTGGEARVFSKKEFAGTIADECTVAYQRLKIRRKHRYIVYKIDGESEAIVIEKASPRNETFEDLKMAVPATDCRYVVYDYEYTTNDGRPTSKLFFLAWMPSNATPYAKMAYTTAKGSLRDLLDGVEDVTAKSKDEIALAFGMVEEEENDSDGDPDDW